MRWPYGEEIRAAVFFIVVMPLGNLLYQLAPIEAVQSGMILTTVGAVIMAAYVALMFHRPAERPAQTAFLFGAATLGIISLTCIQGWHEIGMGRPATFGTVAWRGTNFGLHVLTLFSLMVWAEHRDGYSTPLLYLLAGCIAVHTFTVVEYAGCNYGAFELSRYDTASSSCVRRTENPFWIIVPVFVIWLSIGQWIVAQIRARR
jgi:hypothetical protein